MRKMIDYTAISQLFTANPLTTGGSLIIFAKNKDMNILGEKNYVRNKTNHPVRRVSYLKSIDK